MATEARPLKTETERIRPDGLGTTFRIGQFSKGCALPYVKEDPVAVQLYALTIFRDQYAQALEWLRARDVRVDNTRLSRYLTTINDAIAKEAAGDTAHQQADEFAEVLVEASEIILVATLDPIFFEERADVLTKLRRIITGPDVVGEDGDDSGRNYAFEFSTAAILHERNAFREFARGDLDLLLRDGDHPVECKRISSLRRLEQRIREARNQLNAHADAGGPPGIIAVDMSRPIRLAQGAITAVDEDSFMHTAELHARAYIRSHIVAPLILPAATGHGVLGLLVRYVAYGTAGGAGSVRRSIVWNLCHIYDDESDETRLLGQLAEPFGRGPLQYITAQEIEDAAKQVDAGRR
ncbi:MAG: hypothetical protein JSR16_12360 [Proteobacteria bacterium]|nr:hypothetical protein [Pseudomonadota bacterium]